eukprot:4334753-Amphidinium_carterae.1
MVRTVWVAGNSYGMGLQRHAENLTAACVHDGCARRQNLVVGGGNLRSRKAEPQTRAARPLARTAVSWHNTATCW